MRCENDQRIDYPAHFFGRAVWSKIEENKMGEGGERGEKGGMGAAASSESNVEAGISEYNALGSRQALFIMGWTRVLEASGGSGPPKARVLWAPIGTGGVNRRAVSLRSLFAHEPRMVFRDNKRATSSSARTTILRSFALSLFLFLLLPFSSSLTIVCLALTRPHYPLNRLASLFVPRTISFCLSWLEHQWSLNFIWKNKIHSKIIAINCILIKLIEIFLIIMKGMLVIIKVSIMAIFL